MSLYYPVGENLLHRWARQLLQTFEARLSNQAPLLNLMTSLSKSIICLALDNYIIVKIISVFAYNVPVNK